MAGRPTKYSPDRCERIVEALRGGNTRQTACALGGISDETFARWLREHVDFMDSVKKAESEAEAANVAIVKKAALAGTWTAAAWWLERKLPQQWGRTDRVEVTIRQQAEALAAELGVPVDEVIREAERIANRR